MWYAIRTSPQREFALAGRHDEDGVWVPGLLERRGYTAFLPTEVKMKRISRHAKRMTPVSYPLFTGYVFVRAPFSFLHLLAERHVQGVVGFDGQPAPIADAEIARLAAMSGNVVPHRKSVNPHVALRVGERAEITAGPFTGQVVAIAGLHGSKARIFVNLFGSRKEAEIATEHLTAA